MALFRSRELAVFYQQLGQLYKSGIPPTEGLAVVSNQMGDSTLQAAVQNIHQHVLAGRSLGQAFAAHPEVFSELQVALVKVGEENGFLDRNFFQLAEMYEKEYASRKKLLFGMAYPAFLFVAALFLPKVYIWWTCSLGEYLKAVFLTALPFLVVFSGVYAGYLFFYSFFHPAYDRFRLAIPVLGGSLRKLALARFSRSLAMLYSSGVDLRRSLRLAIRSLANRYLEDRCRLIELYLEGGSRLTEALAATRVFPREFLQAIDLGERTGNLDGVLEQTARLYEYEAESAITTILIVVPIAIYIMVALYIAYIIINFYAGYYGNIGKMSQ